MIQIIQGKVEEITLPVDKVRHDSDHPGQGGGDHAPCWQVKQEKYVVLYIYGLGESLTLSFLITYIFFLHIRSMVSTYGSESYYSI